MDVQRPTEEELREYFAALAAELNLRLLLESMEGEAGGNGRGSPAVRQTLWIEDIRLTSYEAGRTVVGWKRLLHSLLKFLRKKV